MFYFTCLPEKGVVHFNLASLYVPCPILGWTDSPHHTPRTLMMVYKSEQSHHSWSAPTLQAPLPTCFLSF